MAYFEDLSAYAYSGYFSSGEALNVGWLDSSHVFEKAPPTEELLDVLWAVCTVSVARSRGFHLCDLCTANNLVIEQRYDHKLILGGAEIRVFSNDGRVYASPNLIYHYVRVHNYKPPNEFISALMEGGGILNERYFENLVKLDLEWKPTTPANEDSVISPVPVPSP